VLIICLVVAALAVARLSMLITQDQLTIGIRQRVVNRFGEVSKITYLFHCDWCMSMWLAIPIMPLVAAWPNRWVLAAMFVPAASLVAGLLSKLRG
jgi:hypothetical protein